MDPISAVIGIGMLILIGGVSAEGAWRKFRAMRANGGADGWRVNTPPAPVGATPPAQQHSQRRIGRYVTADMLPNARKHTAVVGSTGDGKTTTMNSLLVADIASGAQCVVCSTHFTYYHPDDQTIDLRPLADRFQVAYTAPAIRAALDAACKLKDQRMALYRAGKPVGHDVCLYFGEWDTSIQRLLGQWAADRLQELLDEGRKTNVWVSFVEVHGAQVKRFGGDSAVRAAFRTRLTGNVDATSWRAFVGSATPQTSQPQGQWMTERGPVRVEPPTSEQIARVAAATLPRYAPLVSKDMPTPDADKLLENLMDRAEKGGNNFPPPETDFPAAGSDFTISVTDFSATEIAEIAAKITHGGKGKSEIVTSMPRYSGRKHKAYSDLYDQLKAGVERAA